MSPTFYLALAIAAPFAAAVLIGLTANRPNLRESVSLVAGIAALFAGLFLLPNTSRVIDPTCCWQRPCPASPSRFRQSRLACCSL